MTAKLQTAILWFGSGLLLFLVLGVLWLTSPSPDQSQPRRQSMPRPSLANPTLKTPLPHPETGGVTDIALKISALLKAGAPSMEVATKFLELKAAVHVAEPNHAAEQLIELLRTGEDWPTNMAFEVGEEGVLASTGTWRGMLLDLLGQTDPEQSARFSQELLGQTQSQEEYAICLRNLGWASFEGDLDHTIQEGVRTMLSRSEWVQDPQPPFLEALDAATATMMSQEMTALVLSPSTPYLLKRGAFIALDRMMLKSPAEVGNHILQERKIFDQLPLQRASLLSRLDPSDPNQVTLIEAYLQQNNSPEEWEYFFSIFPLTSTLDSHRLITGWDEHTSIINTDQRIKATLRLVEEWSVDPQLTPLAAHLSRLSERLKNMDP